MPGSARIVLTAVLNATAAISNKELFPHGLACEYLFWRSPLYSNALGAGALALLVSQAFNLIAILFCMDMVRMRVSRVKDMMLLSGLPRIHFWAANMVAHLVLYWVAFGISMAILRGVGGLDGIKDNNFLGFFISASASFWL